MTKEGYQEFIKYVVLFVYFYKVEMSYYQGSMNLNAILGSPMLKLHKTSRPKPSELVPKSCFNLIIWVAWHCQT
jgi:hypothetical protein